jgi:hypothetical protein
MKTGFYLTLFHGPKMVKSFHNNCEWEPVYITIVPYGRVLSIGRRNFGAGMWLQRFGSQNWTRIDNGNHKIHSVEPLTVPSMEETNKTVTRQAYLENFLYVVRYIDRSAKNPNIINKNPQLYKDMIDAYDQLLEKLK